MDKKRANNNNAHSSIGMRVLYLIMGVGIYLYSAYFLSQVIENNCFTNEAQNWPTVQGEIMNVRLGRKGVVSKYYPIVDYKYTVDDMDFWGSRISSIAKNEDRLVLYETAKESMAKFRAQDDLVDVFYDPQNPQRSVLIWESFPLYRKIISLLFLLGLGSLFLLLLAKPTLWNRK